MVGLKPSEAVGEEAFTNRISYSSRADVSRQAEGVKAFKYVERQVKAVRRDDCGGLAVRHSIA